MLTARYKSMLGIGPDPSFLVGSGHARLAILSSASHTPCTALWPYRFAYHHFCITQPDWSIWSGINFDGRVVPLQCSSARDLVFFPVWGIEGDSAWFACHVVERFAEQSLVGVMKPPNVWRRPRGRSNLGWSFRRPIALSQLTVLPMLLSMLPRCSFKPYTTTHISHGVVWSYWLPLYCAPSLASQTLSVSQSLLRSGDLGPLCVNFWNAIIESIMCKDAIIGHIS